MSRWRRQTAFTLAELACAIGISAIILGALAVAGLQAKASTEKRSAQASISALEAALASFQNKRGAPPSDLNHDGLTAADEIVSQLKDWGLLAQEFSSLDPWGKPYVIVLKRDYYSTYDTFFASGRPYNDDAAGFQIYSMGPDGVRGLYPTDSESADDLTNFSM